MVVEAVQRTSDTCQRQIAGYLFRRSLLSDTCMQFPQMLLLPLHMGTANGTRGLSMAASTPSHPPSCKVPEPTFDRADGMHGIDLLPVFQNGVRGTIEFILQQIRRKNAKCSSPRSTRRWLNFSPTFVKPPHLTDRTFSQPTKRSI